MNLKAENILDDIRYQIKSLKGLIEKFHKLKYPNNQEIKAVKYFKPVSC